MKRIPFALSCAAVVPLMFWMGGYDFDRRGLEAALCAAWTLAVSLYIFAVTR